MHENPTRKDVDQFILDEMDTVPHLEALLLLWNKRPQGWSLEDMANALYVNLEAARVLMEDLERRGFATLTGSDSFQYRSNDRDSLIAEVEKTYRREIVRISNMIHGKPAASLREFARAFRWKRDRD